MTLFGSTIQGNPPEAIRTLVDFFHRGIQPLYAVLDSAKDGKILPLVVKSGCEFGILYGSRLASVMDDQGPHLVALPKTSPFLLLLLERGWGNNWGLFFTSSADFASVRRHLRRLLTVKLPNGGYALFRFYDPRVLPNFLENCDSQETERFFGPVGSIFIESSSGQGLRSFYRTTQPNHQDPCEVQLMQHYLKLPRGG
jgi:hypothetical protein